MSWPLASHFSTMLQNPRLAFRDSELQGCRIEKDRRNQPRPWSGAFAVVYKGMSSDGSKAFAVRVFTTESPERRERYDRISDYLRTRRLKCLVDFEFRDRSIRSGGDGKWYPLIVMDWVQGETLFKWARARCLEGNRQALAAAADRWVEVVKELADASVAHGDLQHANVMVTGDGQLKLVDYDCMCVPALVGRRNLEVGVEPYQHPGRNETTHLSLDLDNFSALVIYVALRALAADPALWVKYVERQQYDKLLFRLEDFQAQAASPLYRDLQSSPQEDVRDLAEQLFSLFRVRLDQVPPLSHLTNSYAKVEQLLVGRQWDAAVELLNRRGQFRDAPEHLKPLIHQAYEHVCRQQAWAAFQKIPPQTGERCDRQLVNAWNEALFAGFEPAERQRPRIVAARQHVTALDRLRHLVQQASGTTSFAWEWSIVAAAKPLPEGYHHSLEQRVERARRSVEAIKGVERAVRELDDDAAIVAAWQEVVRAECPGLVNADHQPRIERARKRLPLVRALREIPQGLSPDQLDRRLLDIWQDDLLEGCEEGDAWRPAYEQAVYRKELLRRIEEAIGSRNELLITQLTEDPCLEGYSLPASWTSAVRMARDRIAKTEALEAALRDGDGSSFLELFDARIIRQYNDRFRPYESLLGEWTRSEILLPERLGLRPAVGRASLVCVDETRGTVRVRWTWPQQRFADECLLAVCPHEPHPDDDPRDLEVHHRVPLDRQNWESGGGSRLLHLEPQWSGSYVVVWAMIDLGFRMFCSEPLLLGRLEDEKKRFGRGRKGWRVLPSSRSGPSGSEGDRR